MNRYDFDEPVNRRGTNCVKWDERAESDIIPLWVADMDFRVAPAIQKAIERRAAQGVFGYTHVPEAYYEAIISWFRRRHHWSIERSDILYTIGVVPAISCCLKAMTLPGEKVVMLTPVYNCFYSSIKNNGCEVVEVPLQIEANRYVIDFEDFEAKCADEKCTVFLLCNPHNPTGRVWTREELRQMSDICRRHQVRIVSDEIHCELVMPGHHFCPMGLIDETAIILNSPSKSFNIAGLQTANIICTDAATRRRLDRVININEVCDLTPFGPVALIAAYNESENWIDELNKYLWDNYTILCDFIGENLPQWKVMPLEGTYLVWIDVSSCCDNVEAYCDMILQKCKVWLNPGSMYGSTSGEGYLRINLACPKSTLQEALKRLATI